MIGFLMFYWLFSIPVLEGLLLEQEMEDEWQLHVLAVLFGGLLLPVGLGVCIGKYLDNRE